MVARVEPEHDEGGCVQLSPTCPRSPSVPYTICSFLEDLADNGRVVGVVKRLCCLTCVLALACAAQVLVTNRRGCRGRSKGPTAASKEVGGAGEGPKDRRRHQKPNTKKAGSNETWVAVFRLGCNSSSPTSRTPISRVVSAVFSSVP